MTVVVRRDKYDKFGLKKVCGVALIQVRCMGVITHGGGKGSVPICVVNMLSAFTHDNLRKLGYHAIVGHDIVMLPLFEISFMS